MLTDATRERDFPALAHMTYLNSAAEGIPPREVLMALTQYGNDKLLGMEGRALHEAQWQNARRQVAQAYDLTADEIGICSCSSEAFNLAARALQLQAGDEVIINDLDFPAGATPWLSTDCPATVRLWRSAGGALRVEDLIPLLSSRTRLMSTSLVSFFNGFQIPLAEVVASVRRHSPALVAVDVTQALGRVPLELEGADLVVSSTHKWILATHGGGLVGVPKKGASRLTVPAGGWFNLEDPFGAQRFERVVVKPGAASFSVGMPNYPAVYAIGAALRYIQGIGVEAIDNYARPLVLECLDGLRELGVELLTPVDSASLAGIIAFRHPRSDEIHARLREKHVHVMCHAGRLRISLHGYNTPGDVRRLLVELRGMI